MSFYKKYLLSLLLLLMITLNGCTSKTDNSSKYVDLDSAKQDIEENRLEIQNDNFLYDNKPYNVMKMNSTIDSDYFYTFENPHIKIDLQSGRIRYICENPGCAHTYNSPNCLSYQNLSSPVATTNGIFCVQDNKVILLHDNNEDIIFENSYYTDYEKETYPDNMSVLSALTIYGDCLYIIGPTYFFTYNLKTTEINGPHELCDSICMSMAVTAEYLYYSNDSLELFQQDIKTNSITKLDDKVGQVCVNNDNVYYIKYINYDTEKTPCLYRINNDGTDPQKLIEDCWVNYCIAGDHIYYQSFLESRNVYVSKLDGSDKTQIKLEYNGMDLSDSINIFSIDSLDNVFMVSDFDKVFFIFDAGSAEYKAVALEEE